MSAADTSATAMIEDRERRPPRGDGNSHYASRVAAMNRTTPPRTRKRRLASSSLPSSYGEPTAAASPVSGRHQQMNTGTGIDRRRRRRCGQRSISASALLAALLTTSSATKTMVAAQNPVIPTIIRTVSPDGTSLTLALDAAFPTDTETNALHWVALGISTSGVMTGSRAVIGVPPPRGSYEEDLAGGADSPTVGAVGEYMLGGKDLTKALAAPVTEAGDASNGKLTAAASAFFAYEAGTVAGTYLHHVEATFDIGRDAIRERICGTYTVIWAYGDMIEANDDGNVGAATTFDGQSRQLAYHGDNHGAWTGGKINCSPPSAKGEMKTVDVLVTVGLQSLSLKAEDIINGDEVVYIEAALEGVWQEKFPPAKSSGRGDDDDDNDADSKWQLKGQIKIQNGTDVDCPEPPILGVYVCHEFTAKLVVKGRNMPDESEVSALVVSNYDEAERDGTLTSELADLGQDGTLVVTSYDLSLVDRETEEDRNLEFELAVMLYNSAGVTAEAVLGGLATDSQRKGVGNVPYRDVILDALRQALLEKGALAPPLDTDDSEEKPRWRRQRRRHLQESPELIPAELLSLEVFDASDLDKCPPDLKVPELDRDGNVNACQEYDIALKARAPPATEADDVKRTVADAYLEAATDGTMARALEDAEREARSTAPFGVAGDESRIIVERNCLLCPRGTALEFPDKTFKIANGVPMQCSSVDATLAAKSSPDECRDGKIELLSSGDFAFVCGYCLPLYETKKKKVMDTKAKMKAQKAVAAQVCTLCADGHEPCLPPDTKTSSEDLPRQTCGKKAVFMSFSVDVGTTECTDEQAINAAECGCGVKDNIFNGVQCRPGATGPIVKKPGGGEGGKNKPGGKKGKKGNKGGGGNKKGCKKNPNLKKCKNQNNNSTATKKKKKGGGRKKNNNSTATGGGKKNGNKGGNNTTTVLPSSEPSSMPISSAPVSSAPTSAPTLLPSSSLPTAASPTTPSPTKSPTDLAMDAVEVTLRFGLYNSKGIKASEVAAGTAKSSPNATFSYKTFVEAALGFIWDERYGKGKKSLRRRRRLRSEAAAGVPTTRRTPARSLPKGGIVVKGSGSRQRTLLLSDESSQTARKMGDDGDAGSAGDRIVASRHFPLYWQSRRSLESDEDEYVPVFNLDQYLARFASADRALAGIRMRPRRLQTTNGTDAGVDDNGDDEDEAPRLELKLVDRPTLEEGSGVDVDCPSYVPATDAVTGQPNVCGTYDVTLRVQTVGDARGTATLREVQDDVTNTFDEAVNDGNLTAKLNDIDQGRTFTATVPNGGFGTSAEKDGGSTARGSGGGGTVGDGGGASPSTKSSDDGGGDINIGAIVGGVLAGVVLIFVCAGLFAYYRRKSAMRAVKGEKHEEEERAEAARAWNEDENTGFDTSNKNGGSGGNHTDDTGYDEGGGNGGAAGKGDDEGYDKW